MKKLLLSVALAMSVASYAGGFRVSLQGVRQFAQAHTSAHTEDASVAFFNPAGISFIPAKLSVAAGGFGVSAKFTYQDLPTMQSFDTDNPISTPVYAAVTYKVLDDLSLGFSFSTPYGSHLIWDDQWTGRETVQELNLRAFYFMPMISYKLAPWMSVGVSYIHMSGQLDWRRTATALNGSLELTDHKAKGDGFGVGFYFKPNDKLDVSLAYRSAVIAKADHGVAQFKNVSPALYPLVGLDANGADTFAAELPLVDEYTIGFTYRITPKWSVSGDFNLYGWERYRTLKLKFGNAKLGNDPNDPTLSVTPKNFHNTNTWRIGTEYKFNNTVVGRLGYYFDESPYDDDDFSPETPSLDEHVVTGGLGLYFGNFGVDLAAGYAIMPSRQVSNSFYNMTGQLKGSAFIFGLGLSYNAF